MIASDENSNGPMFQVWSWSESSECGRQIDIYRWAIDYLLERSLPIPTQLTNRAAALLMEWERELETMDPVAVARHELSHSGGPRHRDPVVSHDLLPPNVLLDAADMSVIDADRPWESLCPDRQMLLLARMAADHRARSAGGVPAGLVERIQNLAQAVASGPEPD